MPFTIPDVQSDVPDGTYTASFESVDAVEEGGFDGNGFRRWHFLVDVQGQLTPLTDITSYSTGPKSTAYAWLTAILGRPLKAGEQVADPVGHRVTITIGRNRNGYAKIVAMTPFTTPDQAVPGLPR